MGRGYLHGLLMGFAIALVVSTMLQHFTSTNQETSDYQTRARKSLLETVHGSNSQSPFGFIRKIFRSPNDGKIKSESPTLSAQEIRSFSAPETPIATPKNIPALSNLDLLISQKLKQNSSLTNKVMSYSKAECKERYGKKRFLTLAEKRKPPMLYTFPGSGNTWGRLLIEHATGIYTGSVYNDRSLLDALPGEFTCDWRVSVVKVHPHTHDFSNLNGMGFNSDNMKCKRGNIQKFDRAVLLIRNPYDSIWSEYQRRVTQSHVDGILKSSFNWHRWQANAANLAHQYYRMWDVHYMGIERAYKPEDILYIKYEDLKDKSRRVEALAKVVKFLNRPVSLDQVECSFVLSNSNRAHRSIDADIEMTKDIAYTEPLACRMWGLFGKYAQRHGYLAWANYTCKNPPPLPHVNVGPRGEYNNEWVRPGAQLLDFGGHDNFNAKVLRPPDISGIAGSAAAKLGSFLHGPSSFGAAPMAVRRPQRDRFREAIRIAGSAGSSSGSVSSSGSGDGGMTMEEAMSVGGIGKLGEDGPVWA